MDRRELKKPFYQPVWPYYLPVRACLKSGLESVGGFYQLNDNRDTQLTPLMEHICISMRQNCDLCLHCNHISQWIDA